MPPGQIFPVYFTVQPGGAVVTPGKVQVIYPNADHAPPGARMPFWSYEPNQNDWTYAPDQTGWKVYGYGHVTKDGRSVVPDRGLYFFEFTGAGDPSDDPPPPNGPKPGGNPTSGEPVDLQTGLYVLHHTDFSLADVLPLDVTRTYRPNDPYGRFFGIGQNLNYGILLYQVGNQYHQANLILSDGGQVGFVRVSPGIDHDGAVFKSLNGPGLFFAATLRWSGTGWNLRLTNGTILQFTDFNASGPNAVLLAIQDRAGNTTRVIWGSGGEIDAIKSPNGRWVQLSYQNTVISQVQDDLGRTTTYAYTGLRLTSATDAHGGVTTYTYDTTGNMHSITDPRGVTYLTNTYDSNNRVIQQTLSDGGIYSFAYTTTAAGQITQTRVTDPRGQVRQVTFNADGYVTGDTRALGTAVQQTTADVRQAGSDLLQSMTDPLGRATAFTYDANGNVTSVTRLAGTAQAQTYAYTYDPTSSQITSSTDPLGHTSTYTYDAFGNLLVATDPLGNHTTFTYNVEGEPLSITDPLGHTTRAAYTFGDPTSLTDALSRTASQFVDAAGRVLVQTDPLGATVASTYDPLDRLTQVVDPLGGATAMSYDPDGHLASLTDADGHSTTYTYDPMDRVATVTDPLHHVQFYIYDVGGNLTRFTDRKGQVTSYQYDALDRRTLVTVADGSTITLSYDAGNRRTQAVDSHAGTIGDTYDGLDRLLSETTPQGTITYSYDAANRRMGMTVGGQPLVSYSYDNADRLMNIAQGTSAVGLQYDAASRRTALTLPGGISQRSSYDAANELAGITYALGSTTLGSLSYGYDADGRATTMGGSWARTGIPAAVSSATYNADNELTLWGSVPLTYDANGNLTTAGATTYAWNARNQLASIAGTGGPASFSYDAFGRRIGKTVGGTTTGFLNDGSNVVQELSGATPSANLLTGLAPNQTFVRTSGGQATTLLTDRLGSTLALASGAGTVQTQYTYDPYGNAAASGTASSNPFQYTGQQNDGTGLDFYHARSYSPLLGRFISQDPLGFSARDYAAATGRWTAKDPLGFSGGTTSLYQYALDDPINVIDPSGLWGAGVYAGASAEAGAGYGAAASVGGGFAGFSGGTQTNGQAIGPSNGFFGNYGGFIGGPTGGATFPSFGPCDNAPPPLVPTGAVLGASAGVGVGAFVTNAASVSDLGGPFNNININTPIGSINISYGGGIWEVGVSVGPSVGASVSTYQTNTATTNPF
jgi:RHS repeat-associated protein